jgi:thiol-disulfide isomerase/thioredoxin
MKYRIVTLFLIALGFALAGSANAELKIGDPAPKLQVASWVQGEPVKAFEPGKMYVVEFWATWCAPCRASIPHINDLYQEFKDRGAVVIGQDVMEDDDNAVAPFVKKMGTNMTYRVALDDKSKDSDGAMQTTWLKAAGLEGIPNAVIINKKGVVAWMGHPMEITKKLLEDILTDHYDVAKAAVDYQKEQANQAQISILSVKLDDAVDAAKWDEANAAVDEIAKLLPPDSPSPQMVRVQILLRQKKYDDAYRLAGAISDTHQDDALAQTSLAWTLVTRPELEKRDLPLAEKIAERANTAAKGKNADVLDTLARIQFMNGKKQAAIATEQKAVDVADSDTREGLKAALKSLQDGKLPGGGE